MENLGSILSDTSRLMRRSFDARARAIGVTRAQWQVLATLRRHEGINQGGLAEQLDVEPITVCRMVDRLQEADLVERRADVADRRSWRLYLTPRAHQLLEQLRPLAEALIEDMLDGVSPGDRLLLEQTLLQVRANLARSLAEPVTAHG
ncbi:MarR family winged helix-turn-helix transcriptional regulator [Sandarakinorhabdus oryzae]|uniref:MarR family winged helix-turn-helix transcriptional regulator n=1 Tax=Sandarakinorhabdus oryzae TaxID=2675220 RepID=UPI0012E2FF7E|nr:MarR family transcriptional regulator [Sandarakinorhabdus oryzae]